MGDRPFHFSCMLSLLGEGGLGRGLEHLLPGKNPSCYQFNQDFCDLDGPGCWHLKKKKMRSRSTQIGITE